MPFIWILGGLAALWGASKVVQGGFSLGGGSRAGEQSFDACRNDLAAKLGVPVARIQVASAQKVIWPGATIDCLTHYTVYANDMATIAPVPSVIGYLVTLALIDGSWRNRHLAYYAYRVDPSGHVMLCTSTEGDIIPPSVVGVNPHYTYR